MCIVKTQGVAAKRVRPLTDRGIYRMNKWALSLALVLLCVSTAVAQEPAATAMGTPVAATAASVTPDATVMRLASAYVETAARIHAIVANKEHIATSPHRLKSELKKVGMFLEPMREEVGKSVTPEQESAALATLRADAELGTYADAVGKLWKQTAVSIPLSVRFVGKTVVPDVVGVLEQPESDVLEVEESSDLPYYIMGGIILLLVGIIVCIVLQKQKEKELLEEPLPVTETQPAPAAPEPKEEVDTTKVKDANSYALSYGSRGETFIRSTDLENVELTLPTRRETNQSYMLVVKYGQVSQKFKLSKRVVSFGRSGSRGSNPDVPLDLPSSASRMMGVLIYRDDQEGMEPSWMLAVNQQSDLNPGWQHSFCAYLHRKGVDKPLPDVAFTLKQGDIVEFLLPNSAEEVDANQVAPLSVCLTIEKN